MKITTAPLVEALRFIRPYATGTSWAQAVSLVVQNGSLRLEYFNSLGDSPAFQFHLEAEISDEEDRVVGVNVRLLSRMLHSAPESVTLHIPRADGINHTRVGISYPGAEFSLTVANPDWRQELLPRMAPDAVQVDVAALALALGKVYGSSSDDEGMWVLNCVHLRADVVAGTAGLLAEAMNGHQYQGSRIPASGWANILPASGVLIRRKHVVRLLPILRRNILGEDVKATVVLGDVGSRADRPLWLHLSGSRGMAQIPLYPEEYPNTESFLDKARKGGTSVIVTNRDLRRALTLVNAFDSTTDRSFTFQIEKESVVLHRKCNASMESAKIWLEIPAKCEGPLSRLAFSSGALLSLTRPFTADETIALRMSGPESPCLITGSDHHGDETILMPMKIVDEE